MTLYDWVDMLPSGLIALAKDRTFGGGAIAGSLLVFFLMMFNVVRYPSSLGGGPFIMNTVFLSGYGMFGAWVWRQRKSERRNALVTGARAGVALGIVLILGHVIEWFAIESRAVQIGRGVGTVLLMLGLLAAAGSAAWARTRSIVWATIAGLWCGSVAIITLLSFAWGTNIVFEAHGASWLRPAFLASGMNDAGAFVVRNSLESTSEILIRMPIAALVLSFCGGLSNAWIIKRSRALSILAAWFAVSFFIVGIASLWYADSLDRAARPPFVIGGVLTVGIALCGAHPVLSSLSRLSREPSSVKL